MENKIWSLNYLHHHKQYLYLTQIFLTVQKKNANAKFLTLIMVYIT